MEEFKNLTINESFYDLEGRKEKGTIAVFIYTGSADPKTVLDHAIHIYAGTNGYHEFIDANLDNPWTRVIMNDVNNMPQRKFNETDRMKK
jgi:hypothetical protein